MMKRARDSRHCTCAIPYVPPVSSAVSGSASSHATRATRLVHLAPAAAQQLAKAILDPEQASPELRVLRSALIRSKSPALADSATPNEEAEAPQAPVLSCGSRRLYDAQDQPVRIVDLADLKAPDVPWECRNRGRGKRAAAAVTAHFLPNGAADSCAARVH